jgi:hypothetical protein
MSWLARARLSLLLLAAMVAAAPTHADELEYPVKAEFVERFTRFVDWPNQTLNNNPQGAFIICVLGDSAIEAHLQRLARERRIKDRPVEIRHLKPGADPGNCHVLFIAPSERPRLKQILSRTSGRPILTIGDAEGFAKEGVLINLIVDEDGHVRFEICGSQLRRSGLNMSAQMLRLARVVEEQP